MAGNTGIGKMHMDLYTSNAPLTQKANFWCNFVSSLKGRQAPDARLVDLADRETGLAVHDDIDDVLAKYRKPSIWSLYRPLDVTLYDLLYEPYLGQKSGAQDLRAPDERIYRTIHPSIVHTLPDDFPELKHEFSKLESQMFDRPRKRAAEPLTPILPDAHDRIFTPGFNYLPVHTEIYGTYRPRTARFT